MAALSFTIRPAQPSDREWAAALMTRSEPVVTLGRCLGRDKDVRRSDMTHWKHMTDEKMCLVIAAALVALWGATASAQGPQGTLSGVVRDGTGAALPGVTVTATNQATNASQNATTGGDGAYSLSLPAATYSVTAPRTPFRRPTHRDA